MKAPLVPDRSDLPPPEWRLAAALSPAGGLLALAESCTGGLIAHRVTDVPGSSAYFDRGFVVYSNRAKVDLLGVPEAVIENHGAVSEACARAMIEGMFQRTPATIGAAVTGIAGPSGGTTEKPVGSVWVAWGKPGSVAVELLRFNGGRAEVKRAAAEAVLQRLVAIAEGSP